MNQQELNFTPGEEFVYSNSGYWLLSQIVKKDKIITYGIVQAGPHIHDGIPYIKSGASTQSYGELN